VVLQIIKSPIKLIGLIAVVYNYLYSPILGPSPVKTFVLLYFLNSVTIHDLECSVV